MTTRRGPLIALLAAASFAAPDAASATVRAVDKSGADNATCSVATPCARTVRRRGCRRGRRCTRLRPAGALTRNAGAGATTVPFSGRLGRRALQPGPYRATLVATGADGTCVPARTLTFRVVPKRGG